MTFQIPQNDAGDRAFDRSRAVREGQSGGDCVVVVAQASGERPDRGGAVGFDVEHPVAEVFAAALGEHDCELVHVLVGDGERRTASQDLFQLQSLVLGEPVEVAGDPAGDLPDGGRDRHRLGRNSAGAQRMQVGADGLEAAAITEFGDLAGHLHRVDAAGGEPLLRVRLVRVEQAIAPRARPVQQLLHGGGPREAAYRLALQAQLAGDHRDRPAGGEQVVHRGPALPGPSRQPPLHRPHRGLGRTRIQHGSNLIGSRFELVRLGRKQCGAFGDHGLLHRLDEIAPQVPAVGDLDRVR